MNVLFVSAEVAPFAKTGGLGDVSAALPRQLRGLGHDVRVFLPLYARVHEHKPQLELVVVAQAGDPARPASSPRLDHRAPTCPRARCRVCFVRCPALYDRPSIYGNGDDEHLRFATLSWAALLACEHLDFSPHIAHVNDWQTSLIPLLLRTRFNEIASSPAPAAS